MKETLDQLTIGQFIDLLCGEVDVILSRHEIVGAERKAIVVRNLILEYKQIADKAGANQYLSTLEEMARARIEVAFFEMCFNLVKLNEPERTREAMMIYGIHAQTMSSQRIEAEAKSRLARAKGRIADIQNVQEVEPPTSEYIRRQFDEQTAAMIAHFKFQIDTTTMKATVYAHLVARQNRDIKSQLAVLSKN